MESALDYHTARAMLEWQVELGVCETIADRPIDRYDLPDRVQKPTRKVAAAVAPPAAVVVDVVAEARAAAAGAQTLEALKQAMAQFEHCDLKKGARNLVFSDGIAGAEVMVIGEAPGREEDREGRPFVGRAGQFLDQMFGAIDRSREASLYITNVVPWRPPQNREPTQTEIDMMEPFLARHVALAQPRLLIVMGNVSALAVLKQRGILRMRGNWASAWDLPVMPMVHPAYLLRNPAAKREAWADLLAIQARLRALS